jgi:hypothetical protein
VRRAWLPALIGLLVVGCGSGSEATRGRTGSVATLDRLAEGARTLVPLVAGTGDLAPGRVRYTFLVVGPDGRTIDRPRASVWLARGRNRLPLRRGVAHLESVGTPETQADAFEPQTQYVTYLDVPAPGRYWLLARPAGAATAALGEVAVKARTSSPAVGARAPRAPTPKSRGGISTPT